MINPGHNCGSCFCWVRNVAPADTNAGTCHCHPPQTFVYQDKNLLTNQMAVHQLMTQPITHESHWCAEGFWPETAPSA